MSIPWRRTSGVALLGLTLVLAGLSGFTVWMDIRTEEAVEEAAYAHRVAAQLERVSDATDEAEFAGTRLYFAPSEATLRQFEEAVNAIWAEYEVLLAAARPEDRARIDDLASRHRALAERYVLAARAGIRGEGSPVSLPAAEEARQLIERFRALVTDFRARSEGRTAALREFQRRSSFASAAVTAMAVLLAAGFGVLTRLSSRHEGRVAAEMEQLRVLAAVDPLTGLGNSRAFQRALRDELESTPEGACALAILDIDHLREINELYGPAAGDLALHTVAAVVANTVYENHRVFRIGADEFAILMPATSGDGAYFLLERVRERCDKELDGTTVSIGFSTASLADADAALLQEQAAAALEEAKRRGRNMVVAYDPAIFAALSSAAKAGELRRLLNEGGVSAVFQPIWEIGTGRLFAFEGLSRLPNGSTLRGPQEAFDLAERIGRAHELDMHCRHAIIRAASGMPSDVLLFVNLSPYTLSHQQPCACVADRGPFPSWAAALADEFRLGGFDPRQVVLEVTERSSVSVDILAARVRELRAAGFKVALDDVGAGNAGLEMLRRLPVDFVKIDRGVLQSALESQTGRAAMVAIIAFAAVTGAKVIAEGIENEEMLDLVRYGGLGPEARELLVHAVQGYLFGRPGKLQFEQRANPLAKAA